MDFNSCFLFTGSFFFSITNGNAAGKFVLDRTTGIIRVAGSLDYETVTNYSLTIIAVDKQMPFMTGTTTVSIIITDVNDNAPVCTSSLYSGTVSEDAGTGFEVADVDCTDADIYSGFNTLKYSISQSNPKFAVDQDNGKITVAGSLDAEVTVFYNLSVVASDGNFSMTVSVIVTVTNVNDNPPVLTEPYVVVDILEDTAIGSTVYDANATDADIGITNFIFSIMSGNDDGIFVIGASSGIIQTQKTIDRETMATGDYTLIIKVQDTNDGMALSSSSTIVINVIDVNDNSPQCSQSTYSISVDEGVLLSPAIRLNCSDSDLQASPNLNFTIVSGNTNQIFGLNQNNGLLSVVKKLDYETAQEHVLSVDVSDGGNPARHTQLTIYIFVNPVNEYSPVFLHEPYDVTVSEDVAYDSVVLQITASDNDTGSIHGTVRYAIQSGNTEGKFSINPNTGRIIVSGPLDREATDAYALTVSASDMLESDANAKTVTTTFIITIRDVNDNYPKISPASYVVKVNENVANGTSVVVVTATDDDEGSAGTNGLTYTITAGNTLTAFTTNGNTIVTNGVLSASSKNIYILTVEVRDQGMPSRSSKTTVTVLVVAINDHAPGFSSTDNQVSISEDETVGNSIWRAEATDADVGEFAVLRYYLVSGNTGSAFTVDPFNGDVRVATVLDYDNPPNVYVLSIKVEDTATSTNNTRSSTVTLTVSLLDANDETPVFSMSTYSRNLNENGNAADSVLTVTATDKDTDASNGKVTYSIVSGSGLSKFAIGANTGLISTTVNIDYEEGTFYYLIIKAEDGGLPKLSSTCLVQITVIDLNDNVPKFPFANVAVSVSESANVGDVVTTAVATDDDSPVNGNNRITYGFENDSTKFAIDQSTGNIAIENTLDRETLAR